MTGQFLPNYVEAVLLHGGSLLEAAAKYNDGIVIAVVRQKYFYLFRFYFNNLTSILLICKMNF